MKPEILKPETWNCSYAAPPEDINWENLTNSRVMWYLKSGFLHGLILILVVFLTTPKHAAEHFDDFLHMTEKSTIFSTTPFDKYVEIDVVKCQLVNDCLG